MKRIFAVMAGYCLVLVLATGALAGPTAVRDKDGKLHGIENAIDKSPSLGRMDVATAQLDVCLGRDAVNVMTSQTQCRSQCSNSIKSPSCSINLCNMLCGEKFPVDCTSAGASELCSEVNPVTGITYQQIYSAGQLAVLGTNPYTNLVFKNDLDLTGTAPVTGIQLYGELNGAGFKLKGINLPEGQQMFATIAASAVVKDLVIESARGYQAILAFRNEGRIENVTIADSTLEMSSNRGASPAGAFAVLNYGTIQNSVLLRSTINGFELVGGMVGNNFGTISGGRVEGSAVIAGDNPSSFIGGVAGMNSDGGAILNSVILNSTFSSLALFDAYFGGMIGINSTLGATSGCSMVNLSSGHNGQMIPVTELIGISF